MKTESVKDVFQGAVHGQSDVILLIDSNEAKDLRAALAVVDKYKKAAVDAFKKEKKYDPKESEWHMISYAVKNDRVIVSIMDGMIG